VRKKNRIGKVDRSKQKLNNEKKLGKKARVGMQKRAFKAMIEAALHLKKSEGEKAKFAKKARAFRKTALRQTSKLGCSRKTLLI